MFRSLKQEICSFNVLAHITTSVIKYYNKTVISLILFNLICYYMLFKYIFNLGLDDLFLKSMLYSLVYIIINSINGTILYSLVKSYFNMVSIDTITVTSFASDHFIKIFMCNMFYFLTLTVTVYIFCFLYLVDSKTSGDNIRIMYVVSIFQIIPLIIYFKTMFVNFFISVLDFTIFKAINRNLEINKGKKMILGMFSYLCTIVIIAVNFAIITKYRSSIGLGTILNSVFSIFITIYNAYLCINLNYVFTLPENYSDSLKIRNVYTYYMPEKASLINPPNSNSKIPSDYTDKYDYLDEYIKQILDDSNKLHDD